jgi:hypothetical protein
MDIFLKNKFLLRLVLVLIFLNLFSIIYLWSRKKEDPNGQPPKRKIEMVSAMLKDKLNLSNEQEKELNRIREDFFRKEENLSRKIRAQRDSMNLGMFSGMADTLELKKIARHLAENEYQMELYRIEQAQQLRRLCTKEQILKFQDLVLDIRDYFQPQKRNK